MFRDKAKRRSIIGILNSTNVRLEVMVKAVNDEDLNNNISDFTRAYDNLSDSRSRLDSITEKLTTLSIKRRS